MPYWNLEHTTQNHGKKLEGGSGQTEMTVESTTGFLTVAMTKQTQKQSSSVVNLLQSCVALGLATQDKTTLGRQHQTLVICTTKSLCNQQPLCNYISVYVGPRPELERRREEARLRAQKVYDIKVGGVKHVRVS